MIRRLIRRFARWLLLETWTWGLSYGDRVRFNYYGATCNPKHGPYAWVEDD